MGQIMIVNKRSHTPSEKDVYIGRGSPLGNPWSHKLGTKAKYLVKNRAESIKKFEEFIRHEIKNKNPEICGEIRRIIRLARNGDVNLVCFCDPLPCHGGVIKTIVEKNL